MARNLKSGLVRLPIREALAFTTLYSKHSTFSVTEFASVIAEVTIGQIPMQILFSTMLIAAAHPALEDAEIGS